MRTKSRKDLNQTAVVKELRARGYDVDVVERPYDIVVSGQMKEIVQAGASHWVFCPQVSVRVELKVGKRKLSDSQKEYIANLKHPGSFITARSPADDPMPAVKEIEKWFGR